MKNKNNDKENAIIVTAMAIGFIVMSPLIINLWQWLKRRMNEHEGEER